MSVQIMDANDRRLSQNENRMQNVGGRPRRPRKTKSCPLCGSRLSCSCTRSARPSKLGKAGIVTAAKAIRYEGCRADALAWLASHLAPEQKCEVLAEALAAAKTVDTEVPRARAIGLLARHLVPEQKFEALAYALAGAKAIGNERFRAEALGSLAPYILPIQYIDLITSLIEVAARLP